MLQTSLYVLGNSPKGLDQYINTELFLYSVVGSLLSMLESFAVTLYGYRQASCGFMQHIAQIVQCSPVQLKNNASSVT